MPTHFVWCHFMLTSHCLYQEKEQQRRIAKTKQEELEEGRKKLEIDPAADASHPHQYPDGSKGGNRVQQVLGMHAKHAKGMKLQEHHPVINKGGANREYQDCIVWGEELKKHKEHIKEMYDENEMANLQVWHPSAAMCSVVWPLSGPTNNLCTFKEDCR